MGSSVNKSRGGRNFRGDPIEVDSGKENFNPNTSGFGGARVERRNSILVHQCLRVIEEVRNPSLFHLWNELIVVSRKIILTQLGLRMIGARCL
ncbi:hypothetical protein ACOSQ2_009884 [Xanthoceras sorbifolium]